MWPDRVSNPGPLDIESDVGATDCCDTLRIQAYLDSATHSGLYHMRLQGVTCPCGAIAQNRHLGLLLRTIIIYPTEFFFFFIYNRRTFY